MKKMLAVGIVFLTAAFMSNVAFAKEGNAWLKATTNGPADVSRARETMVRVDIEIKLVPIPESRLCEGPYVLTLKYKAAPSFPELFEAVPNVSLTDMQLVPRYDEVQRALQNSGQPIRFGLAEPGLVSIVLYPPQNAKNAELRDFDLELWNRVDDRRVASFKIQVCGTND